MGYEIKQQDWQALSEHSQSEVYNYFLFIKRNAENSNHADTDDDVFTLTSNNNSDVECLHEDDLNKVWTIGR